MNKKNLNSFQTLTQLTVEGKTFHYHSLKKLDGAFQGRKMPYSLRILVENLLRNEDGAAVQKKDIEAILGWNPKAEPDKEIQFTPARVILQDFTGVPCVADLAAMRSALKKMGGDPKKINPLQPVDLVIDHSVQIDESGTTSALKANTDLEFERNRERYLFLKWGQSAFKNFRVVPPGTGIVHQVNLEYLAFVAMTADRDGQKWVYPDTLVGTDSHTTMINGLGVLGWGVGGIEAEAAMLGQPCTMLIPQVIGFKLAGKLSQTATATDLVLTVTQMLRKKGVVGKFVEFFGPGLRSLTLADRATIANMAPEYGATVGLFPVDEITTDYLALTGRGHMVPLVKAYYQEQGFWVDENTPPSDYTDTLELDLSTVEPSLAGPARPQDRVSLSKVRSSFRKALPTYYPKDAERADQKKVSTWAEDLESPFGLQELGEKNEMASGLDKFHSSTPVKHPGQAPYNLAQGSVVIAAITSCTNTSNPGVLMAAGLVAKKAVEKGLRARPWVKTSLAPGSKVVTDYLKESGMLPYLEALGFHVVGYGCTTCIGNSGPLPKHIGDSITSGDLAVAAVLSGNRNFEGRVHAQVRSNYLASPPLVVAYALAGNVQLRLDKEPIGYDPAGRPVYLREIWPSAEEVEATVKKFVSSAQYQKSYSDVFRGDENWSGLKAPQGDLYDWDSKSTYIAEPPYFSSFSKTPAPVKDISGARVLVLLGDSVTTDHISPAGSFGKSSPAGKFLSSLGVDPKDYNSYGARRGHHDVMARGTFGNVRLKNLLVPGVEGGVTKHFPSGEQMAIFDASLRYQKEGVSLIGIAGKEYGTGSSRDWAAKGPMLQGFRAIIAESFERIHRSNLVGMGVLPLQFQNGENASSHGIKGDEIFDIPGIEKLSTGQKVEVHGKRSDGSKFKFTALCRIDTANELEYFKNGGILQYVLRSLAN